MKKERNPGNTLIVLGLLIITGIALMLFRPKGFEAAMGEGFDPDRMDTAHAVLTAADGETEEADFLSGTVEYVELIRLLENPTYSRTHGGEKSIEEKADYTVELTFTDRADRTWSYRYLGESKVFAGRTGQEKPYQVSDKEETPAAVTDYLQKAAD